MKIFRKKVIKKWRNILSDVTSIENDYTIAISVPENKFSGELSVRINNNIDKNIVLK
jgi:hypothetical protein